MTVLPRSTERGRGFHLGPRALRRGGPDARQPAARAGASCGCSISSKPTARPTSSWSWCRARRSESRLKGDGTLGPADVDRILWPLLEGLEQVHNAGFLHRDIKPANILLDADGNPTLIDFGASRAAMAGRTTAMTAIFTPGYAAAEQMTRPSRGRGPTSTVSSATLYHAITGADAAQRVRPHAGGCLRAAGQIAAGGVPAGSAGRHRCRPRGARHRPAAIDRRLAADPGPGRGPRCAGDRGAWPSCRDGAQPSPAAGDAGAAAAPRKGGMGLWLGIAAVVLVAAGWWWLRTGCQQALRRPTVARRIPTTRPAEQNGRARSARRLAKLRAEAAAREKAEQEAALRRQIEDETRQQDRGRASREEAHRGGEPPEGRGGCRGQAKAEEEELPGRRSRRDALQAHGARPPASRWL